EIIAREFAFEGCRTKTAVEMLMQYLHRCALTIKSIGTAVIAAARIRLGLAGSGPTVTLGRGFSVISGMIAFAEPGRPRPEEMITIFAPLADHDYDLHPEARAFIRDNLDLAAKARGLPAARSAFLAILRGPYAAKALTLMLELGIMERFIPETEKIKGRIQYDVYHTYTVDMHSIHTTAHLHTLRALEPEAFTHVHDLSALLLAGFLHDIGKGHGTDHARTGAALAYAIARRLDLPRESAELVRFLVLNHLILANTALRRDLSEEKVAFDCARTAQDAQRLSMLYILTIADSKATGEAAWTEWKAALVEELYRKALMILLKGDLRDPRNVTRLEYKWAALIEHIGVEPAIQEIGGLWVLPQAYILAFDVPTIIAHVRSSGGIQTLHDIHVSVAPQGAHFSLTVIARDRPGLIALLTGILASRHINIHTAKVFTWQGGLAIDVFEVTPPWPDYDAWDQIAVTFKRIVGHETDLAKILAETRPLLKQRRKVSSPSAPVIVIDNDSSDFFTLIEVYAEDRIGLLHAITEALHHQGLNIHRAIITNKADHRQR
ncbi:MAG TPA: HD domain-containing protein, partial [Deltaproteobacteria bacterium]|nr:HD domain-containing protein [Deltaproteobacteria bacterium]